MSVTNRRNHIDAFAVTAPGLEPLCAGELSALGVRPRVQVGGVAWRGELESVARANLWLRTASRVIVRVAEFKATAFFELELAARQIPWDRFVAPGTTVRFRVTCKKSKLYHSDAVGQRLGAAVSRGVSGVRVEAPKATVGPDVDADEPSSEDASRDVQLFIARVVHDVCTISADSSGELLHRRGYRQQLARAPLRETIAAAMLLGIGWDGTTPLVDPMCGSGTIAIEAARMARRIAPGRGRRFAFQKWPAFSGDVWRSLLDHARAGELPNTRAVIRASDRDDGAIDAARANASRAGVDSDIGFAVTSISAADFGDQIGFLVSNPPYGVRVGEHDRLRNLYAQIGNVARERLGGWTVGLLVADQRLQSQTRLGLVERFRTRNGGIPVRLVVNVVRPEFGKSAR